MSRSRGSASDTAASIIETGTSPAEAIRGFVNGECWDISIKRENLERE